MKSFVEFLTEAKGAGNIKNSKTLEMPLGDNPLTVGMNHADPTIDGLRTHLLDIFWPKAKGDKKLETKINQCITTFAHAMDKKLRIDEDIIILLAKCVNMSQEEVTKILSEELDKYYGQFQNIYGM